MKLLRLLLLSVSSVTASVGQGDVVLEESLRGLIAQGRSKVSDLLEPSTKETAIETSGNHAENLVKWLGSYSNGFLHGNLEVRRTTPPELPYPHYGLFATADIPANELLLEIPQEMWLTPTKLQIDDRVNVNWNEREMYSAHITRIHSDDDTFDLHFDDDSVHTVHQSLVEHESLPVNCGTIQRLVDEMNLGEKSQFAPYVDFLKDEPRGQLPADWSEAGQHLLKLMLGYDKSDDSTELPPDSLFNWLNDDWRFRCGRRTTAYSAQAYFLYVQRNADERFVPFFDMLRHSNVPGKINVRNGPIRQRKSVKVYASRDIQAGEELYTSYNFCPDCDARRHDYGTPELFRDYGFVEELPQRWVFSEQGISFDLKLAEGKDKQATVSWNKRQRSAEGVKFMKQQLRRLQDFAEAELMFPDPAVPAHELDMILKYMEAASTALTLAVKASPAVAQEDCEDNNTCEVARMDRYVSLIPQPEIWGDERPATCNSKREYSFNSWDTVDDVLSRYQGVTFGLNPEINDMCFDLDNTVQICSSYRPHYHEMMVHFTARYLDEVKRVVFVGGGDSMLLHEVLKYPSLEKVVGLELDQQVTRSSYKYFGTQPHWDNEKVEWWFGDATKSLLMLPKEYFGSFDLVLVDLSETVMALSVTDELDVMEALALLIKPNGILVKNEYMYLLSQAEIFKHTLHVHWYHVPVVCSQSLILGSNGIDFMRGKYVDHGVDHLYELLDTDNLRYSIVRDYQKNETAHQNQCKDYNTVQDSQVRSPGILMLVDAEDTTIDLQNVKNLEATVIGALEKAGLNIVSTVKPWEDDENGLVAVLLREGYVVARTWASESVCALDLHLWSSFEKHEAAKKALTAALGSTLFSAYRIVAGGMFGVGEWKDDLAKNGPHLNELCVAPLTQHQKNSVLADQTVVDAAIKESFDSIEESDIKVAVVCPHDSCEIAQVLKQLPKVGEILELRACASITDGVDFAKDAADLLFACEKELRNSLASASAKKIRAIAVDTKAPYAMGQIVLQLFGSPIKNKRWLESNMTVVAPILDDKEAWKKMFVEKFRRDIYLEEPVFNADIEFTKSESKLTLAVASSGNGMFAGSLIHMAETLENTTGVKSEIIAVRGGEFIYQDEFTPDRNYVHADYDRTDPYKQWKSQEPLGFQTIFQLELLPNAANKLSSSRISDMTMAALATASLDSDNSNLYEWKQWDLASSTSKSPDASGDGSIIVVLWSEGSIVVVWDGKIHVDVNLFTYEEDFDFADEFILAYSDMKTVLRDEQPRGKGRVVNFMSDLTDDPNEEPYWMS